MGDLIRKAFAVKGYDQLEVCLRSVDGISASVQGGRMNSADTEETMTISVRTIVRNRVGFAYTTSMKKIEETARQAVKNARLSEMILKSLPQPARYRKPRAVYDRELAGMSPEDVVSDLLRMLSVSKEVDTKLTLASGEVSVMRRKDRIVNSNGIDAVEKNTRFMVSADMSLRDAGAWEYEMATSYNTIDIGRVVRKASEMTLARLDRHRAARGIQDIIVAPTALEALLSNTLEPAINSDNVQRKKSMLAGKIGQTVASKTLTITDNALMPGGYYSRQFDREGFASQKTPVIKKGVLTSFLYDCLRAERGNTKSTGNASGSYITLPIVSPSNFVIEPSGMTSESLNSCIDKGILINVVMGAHTANEVTGDFSLTIGNGAIIKSGEIGKQVKECMWSGNIFEVLKKIDRVANDSSQKRSLVSPSVLIRDQNIVA